MAPLYGLDAYVMPPPFSALLSLAMIAGIDALGVFVIRNLPLQSGKAAAWLRYQAPLIGAALIAALTFPLVLLGSFPQNQAILCAASLALWGIIHWVSAITRMYMSKLVMIRIKSLDATGMALALFFLAYGLLALGPVTEADSLDYHIGVALEILRTGAFPVQPEWFHSRLAGSGELLIAIGLSIGAEQFGALLQLSGVLAVVSLFLAVPGRNGAADRWLALAVASSPVFVAWVASPKPMLLPGAMTTAALLIIHFYLREPSANTEKIKVRNAFILVCLLTMTAANMKLNFMLSGGVVGGFAALSLIRSRFRVFLLSIAAPMFLLILTPFAFWKSLHFGGNPIDAFFQAFPGNWPGTAEFELMLRSYRDTQLIFPLSLLIPQGFGSVTTVIGIGLIYLASCVNWHKFKARGIVVTGITVLLVGFFYGQKNARFFLEPFYWLLIAYHLNGLDGRPILILTGRLVKALTLLQSGIVYAMLIIGLFTLLPGALLPSWREDVMRSFANGYATMQWADKVLPPDTTIVSQIRSVALAPRHAIPSDWRDYVSEQDEKQYTSIVVEKKPNFVLTQTVRGGSAPQLPCTSEVYAGPFATAVSTRNPFNAGSPYDAWLLRIDLQCLNEEANK